MSDRTIAERLQPSLLDRLTDNQPTEKTERRDDRVIDLRQMREIIQRDLAWLLNTSDNSALIDERQYPNVVKSVLNYGIKEVAGDFSTKERAEIIRKSIAASILSYEPRIHPGTIDVQVRLEKAHRDTLVTFYIRAD